MANTALYELILDKLDTREWLCEELAVRCRLQERELKKAIKPLVGAGLVEQRQLVFERRKETTYKAAQKDS